MYNASLVTAPLDHVNDLLKMLELSNTAIAQTDRDLEGSQLDYTAQDMIAEWLNYVILNRDDGETLETAIENPDRHFMQFLVNVTNDPTQPLPHHVQMLSRQIGIEFVSAMSRIHWPQQLAWAERMKNHEDDTVVLLADLFSKKAAKKPSDLFCKLTRFAFEADFDGQTHSMTTFDLLNADEIAAVDLTGLQWLPLCILYVQRSSASKALAQFSESALAQRAHGVRIDYRKRHASQRLDASLSYLEDYPLTLRSSVISKATRLGINSTKLCALYRDFLSSIRDQIKIPDDERSMTRLFIEHIDHGKDNKVVSQEAETVRGIRKSVARINSRWIASLPEDMFVAGADDKSKLSEWRNLVLSGERDCPSDIRVDYFMFLYERL